MPRKHSQRARRVFSGPDTAAEDGSSGRLKEVRSSPVAAGSGLGCFVGSVRARAFGGVAAGVDLLQVRDAHLGVKGGGVGTHFIE